MNFRQKGWQGVDWIYLSPWWAFVNAVMNLRIPWDCRLAKRLPPSQEGLCSMEFEVDSADGLSEGGRHLYSAQ